jgi:hypothetical protein
LIGLLKQAPRSEVIASKRVPERLLINYLSANPSIF